MYFNKNTNTYKELCDRIKAHVKSGKKFIYAVRDTDLYIDMSASGFSCIRVPLWMFSDCGDAIQAAPNGKKHDGIPAAWDDLWRTINDPWNNYSTITILQRGRLSRDPKKVYYRFGGHGDMVYAREYLVKRAFVEDCGILVGNRPVMPIGFTFRDDNGDSRPYAIVMPTRILDINKDWIAA